MITLFSFGALYWLLWTLLVYEGGIFLKLKGLYLLFFTPATLRDLGYEGYPYAMGIFEGWIGNLCALIFTFLAITGLWNLYQRKAKKSR
ncbi:MAG: hypothetical protein HY400_05140 [Elusimicrobia bacterium]|nr:hypothetical protein [Elusimicrobiota bacterium]